MHPEFSEPETVGLLTGDPKDKEHTPLPLFITCIFPPPVLAGQVSKEANSTFVELKKKEPKTQNHSLEGMELPLS